MNRYTAIVGILVAAVIIGEMIYLNSENTECKKTGGVYVREYPSKFYSCIKVK